MRDTQLPPQPCPACGHTLSAHASFEDLVPVPGDFSVCLVCGCVTRFGVDLRLSLVGPEEIASEPTELQRELAVAQQRVRVYAAKKAVGA